MFTFFSVNPFSRYILCAFLLLFLFILIFNGPFFGSKDYEDVDTSGEIILARLSRAMAELSALKAQNEELRGLIQNYIPLDLSQNFVDNHLKFTNTVNNDNDASVPHLEFELARRKLKRDINELWNFIKAKESANHTQPFVKELKNSLLFDLGE